MAMNPRLLVPRAVYDPDAAKYLAAVEAADGQALETPVKRAIDGFVRECKTAGIWDAIKASCILCGARTLSGALVPLAGTAPTNNNFVAADYNRETGLVGNASTKYLNANILDSSIPQDSCHVAVYQGAAATTGTFIMGVRADANASVTQINRNTATPVEFTGAIRGNFGSSPILGVASTITFAGFNRSDSSTYTGRALGTTSTFSEASQSPVGRSYYIYSSNNGSGAIFLPSNARLAFYSIGESLDLEDLDTAVSTLVTAIGAAI